MLLGFLSEGSWTPLLSFSPISNLFVFAVHFAGTFTYAYLITCGGSFPSLFK
jgi:hypothetical protein